MYTSSTNDAQIADQSVSKLAQQRAIFSKKFPDHPLGRVSDADFQAALASAEPFAAGPISELVAWLKSFEEVNAMIELGQMIGPWFTVIGFFYNIYSDWQQNKKDRERAKKIVRDVVAAVDGLIKRAVENIEKFIKEEAMKAKLDSLKALQTDVSNFMQLSLDDDFPGIDTASVSELLPRFNELLSFFERTFDESVEASESAQATLIYEYAVEVVQLKNQFLAWQDKTLPHGSNSIAKEGVLTLQRLHSALLPVVRKTTDKQFSQMKFEEVALDIHGQVIRPGHEEGIIVAQSFTLFSYYFRGEAQGETLVFGPSDVFLVGRTDQAEVEKEIATRKEEEFLKVTEGLRQAGEEHTRALAELDILIQEEMDSKTV